MEPQDIIGKNINDVRGTARATHIIEQARTALSQQQITYHTFQHDEAGITRTYRNAYVPLDHIPVSDLPEPTPGVLIVEQDITEAVQEREKRLAVNQDIIQTLVTLVDRRDPFAANHSLVVSSLSFNVATEMGLDVVSIDTAKIAASLMNVGKIVISPQLLTKTDALSNDERKIIRDSLFDAAEMVQHIHFEGPVYDTLRQWQEKYDGTGPLGLKGEQILAPARVLSVANTFIGMISPRSWRNAISQEDAIKFLMNNCDTLFDRRVVVALVHFLENQHGKHWLEALMSRNEAA
mgnify:CR=1 FL=1